MYIMEFHYIFINLKSWFLMSSPDPSPQKKDDIEAREITFCSAYSGLDCGVSDHHKASPDLIFFWKRQRGLMEHNYLMKQIWSIILILNHSGNFLGENFSICVAFWNLFMSENLVLGFWKRNYLIRQIFQCLTVQNHLYWRDKQNFVSTI